MKAGKTPEAWAKNPAKNRQKDGRGACPAKAGEAPSASETPLTQRSRGVERK